MPDETDLASWTTEALVELAQRGDDAAYRQLHQRYNDRLLRGLRLSVPPDLADDAAQEAWVRAYERLGDLDQPSAFFSWLAVIARNSARSVLRGPQRRDVQLDDTERMSVDRQADPYQVAEIKEREEAARSALNKLPNRQRRALQLRWIDGWSYQQIAAITGQSVSAIETLLYRARSNFHRQYESSLSGVEASDDVACYKVRSHIRRLGEGQLSERRRIRVLNHLDRCVRCRTVHDELGETWESRAWLPLIPMPAALRDLLSSLTTRFGSFGGQTLTPAHLAGGVALAATVGLAITTVNTEEPRAETGDSAGAGLAQTTVPAAAASAVTHSEAPIELVGQVEPVISVPEPYTEPNLTTPAHHAVASSVVSPAAAERADTPLAAQPGQSEVGSVVEDTTTLLVDAIGLVSELTSAIASHPIAQGVPAVVDEVVSTTGGLVSSLLGDALP
ncbi:MAG TPA: sigma-70 family RNA polymerase sigma factor [Dehalococcoidia bacterium]|nr:sigma-70 family RNA polymerase sigma factor [Dehalococcoidia bacterium]